MSRSNRSRNQWIVFGVLGSLFLGGLWFISQVLNTDGGALALSGESGVNTSIIEDRTRAASPEMSWINNAAELVEELQVKVKDLEAARTEDRRQDELRREQEAAAADQLLASYEAKIVELEAQVAAMQGRAVTPHSGGQSANEAGTRGAGQDSLRQTFDGAGNRLGEFFSPATAVRPANPLAPLGQGAQNQPLTGGTPASTGAAGGPVAQPFARDFALSQSVNGETESDHPPHLRNYLPAGSYAPAVVLSGVDASTGVSSQAEPIPVIFRITSPAVTAGTRSTRGHTIDLTGCTVTGSARGDLSSERVYVRLLKLSCVQAGNHVFERDVAGYMSGAGKAGARGLVVSREGPLVRNAGIAGALAGLADGVSSVGNAGAGADEASFNEALRGAGAASAAGGISGAANQLSEYYIERAEQYQPVVSLYGGTEVELVFLEGVDLG